MCNAHVDGPVMIAAMLLLISFFSKSNLVLKRKEKERPQEKCDGVKGFVDLVVAASA
jgi:hypothetical protein